jgi:hypothetical protein
MLQGAEVNISDLALRNAISFEVKKDGLTQRQSGDWQLRLTTAGIDMDQRITKAAMGTRFVCVLVEINDDETPVDHVAEERDKWRDLGATKQSGIRCKEPTFWSFLKEELHFDNINSEASAASLIRDMLSVQSRSDLGKPGFTEARQLWHDIDFRYQAWKAREHG